MLKSKKSRIIAIAMSTLLVSSLLAGCGNASKSNTKSAEQIIRYNLGANPKTIDPGLNSSVEGGTVIANAFEGLTDVDANNKAYPGVAKSWDISSDGKHYVFHLRKDAKWSDGKAVTAKDFEYAWKRALAPETASDYAYQLYYLKNGEAYNGGKVSADQVGVKATDDYTLDVQLESSTPYFLSLLAFQTYMPVRKDVVTAHPKDWALNGSTYVSNGAFKMKNWKQKDKLEFVKNPYYWNKSQIKLDKLTYTVLDDATSYMSAYQSGQIDIIDTPPTEQTPSLLKQGKAKTYVNIGTYYYSFNLDPKAKLDPAVAKAMNDAKVRKAISLAIDREALVKSVTKSGQYPSTSFVPRGMVESNGKDFKQKDYYSTKADTTQAKKLLSEAGYTDGKGFPTIELTYNTGDLHKSIAEAIQDMLKKNLNINITLRAVERKVQLDETTKHTYTGMARNGWSADYADPMTFLDMWVTSSGNNVTGYSNPAYDKLIAKAKAETDTTKRFDEMHQAEDILMNDMPVVPLYEYNVVSCIKSYVKGTYRTPMDVLYFTKAYVQK
ncbi:peptide ABC transporter substrate-binding protein [Clostridium sp. DMHC 10]|uniref:peptide ABC transporter substrate-binding protein n=1 Tax=Clostridium sp. DMHC 10 TaxID=747377 RepID=UPI00069E8614|nr:peptide ABC transporter substrate-binding protein [Clostridium sp. DMHC 10]KOF55850.1 peptide ABC transporter substrate-binding protein [Clostridium sp. DMHC 10]